MINERAIEAAQRVVREVVRAGDVVVDATVGNGHDTVFLAQLVGPAGRVLGFDVQAAAIASTRHRVDEAGVGAWVELFEESHANMAGRLDEAAAVMFNLGYLPGGDHAVITRSEESLSAIRAAVDLLRPGGVLAVVCYPGHPGGDVESAAVAELVGGMEGALDMGGAGQSQRAGAPFVLGLRKVSLP